MKINENVNFAENSMSSLILATKLKRKQYFSILKMFKFHSIKDNGNVNFAENSIYSLILVTKLKRNQYFSILKSLKMLFNEN